MLRISGLDGQYQGQPLQVVGSGASLARLTTAHFGEGPVLAINYAIVVVQQLHLPNPLLSMQKDHLCVIPENAILLLHTVESAKEFTCNYEPVLAFSAEEDFGMNWFTPSIAVAVGLAKRMGCSRVEYLCCDSAFGVIEKYENGKMVTPENAGNYLLHPAIVKAEAMRFEMPVEWKRI